MKLDPYLTFDGNGLEVLTFYAGALQGAVENLMTFDKMPDTSFVPDGMEDRLAHGRVDYMGGSLMISDTLGDPVPAYAGFALQTEWDSVEDARAAFATLADGGEITMPFGETFWAAGFGRCTDKFGVPWMVNCDNPA